MKLLRKCFAISILGVLLLVSPGRSLAADEALPADGAPITNIVFDPVVQPLEATVLFPLLPLKRGQAYHAADIRAAIEALYATGRYQDIQVDATVGAGGGVNLKFITKGSWFIGNVTAVADISEPPTIAQIVTVARLRLGEPFDEGAIPAAVDNIHKLLVDNGYFDPDIKPEYKYDDIYQQVQITFHVRVGKRARYGTPEIDGDTSVLSKQEIIKVSRWPRFILPGYKGITQARTSAGIDHIRLRYQKANRVIATVVLKEIEQSPFGLMGTPKLLVTPGPQIQILTPGAKVPMSKLRESVPVFEEHAIDPDLLAEGTTGLREYFEARGFFDVEVGAPETKVVNGVTQISYAVDLGEQHRLVMLTITGNKYFNVKTVRERMVIMPRSLQFPRGRFNEAYRKQDIDTIQGLYESNGFRDAKVTTHVVDDYHGKKGDLAVSFAIEEGPQYTVSTLNVKGSVKLDISKALKTLSSQVGQPFSESSVATDRQTILEEYGEHGFPRATFEWSYKPGTAPHTLDLEFVIVEGEQQFVREVVLTGLKSTRPSLVNKQIVMNPGDPLSPTAMSETQKKLDDLGIFAQVDMAIQNPDGDEERKYVVYDLEEAHKYSLTIAPGAEFARIGGSNAITDLSNPGGGEGFVPRLTVNLTRINFLGRGQTISWQGILSTYQKRALLNYYVPKIFNRPKLDATFSLLYDDTHDIRTFQSIRKEASAQIVQHVSKPLTLFYRFSYRHVDVGDLKIDPLLLPQLAQSVHVGMASINLVHDRRDDPVDPHKGIYTTIEAGVSAREFGSQTGFARLLARNATYTKIGEKLVFARETQFGVQPAFSVPANSDPTDAIPLPERFFGGGGTSLRAFPENQAGPRDVLTGFPLGGSALFFNSTELRFPLYGSNINGVLFEDMGNIFSSLGAMSFRFRQQSPTDFDYTVHAVGFGIRYRTPVGPIRVDLAYSINPPKFNGFPGNYSQLVSCSIANTCQASPQQISHFQFFISIGQAF